MPVETGRNSQAAERKGVWFWFLRPALEKDIKTMLAASFAREPRKEEHESFRGLTLEAFWTLYSRKPSPPAVSAESV